MVVIQWAVGTPLSAVAEALDQPACAITGTQATPGAGTPATGMGTPATGMGTPATGMGTPATGTGTPATGTGTPATGTGTPATGTGTPATGTGMATGGTTTTTILTTIITDFHSGSFRIGIRGGDIMITVTDTLTITDTPIIRIIRTTIPITITQTAPTLAQTVRRASKWSSKTPLLGAVTTTVKLTVWSDPEHEARSGSFSGITGW
jgi:hypothetical protein